MFQAFATTKPNGLGMGLVISRALVEAHGGKLWLEADTIDGAIFHFTLPTSH
jgi:signal transduction histidine kinase